MARAKRARKPGTPKKPGARHPGGALKQTAERSRLKALEMEERRRRLEEVARQRMREGLAATLRDGMRPESVDRLGSMHLGKEISDEQKMAGEVYQSLARQAKRALDAPSPFAKCMKWDDTPPGERLNDPERDASDREALDKLLVIKSELGPLAPLLEDVLILNLPRDHNRVSEALDIVARQTGVKKTQSQTLGNNSLVA